MAATLFISFTALRLYEEAIPRVFSSGGTSFDNVGLAFGVLAFSMLLAAIPLAALLRSPERGPAAKAQMWELVNDQLGLLAALVGAAPPAGCSGGSARGSWTSVGRAAEGGRAVAGRQCR